MVQKFQYPAIKKYFIFYVFMEAIALNVQKCDRPPIHQKQSSMI
ncbi:MULTISPECIES: hypothetical protein [unclassified Microcoleus]|nr:MULTISPECIES: hypothetical protein [unclassified Microcoleus]